MPLPRYDAPFDVEDALLGKFTVSVGNTFLESKFSWVRGVSSFADVRQKNLELKAASGGCPMMRAGYDRTDDFESPELVRSSMKRYNWFLQYVQEKQGGVIQGTKDLVEKSEK